jgi:hypothetical protein
MRLWLTVVGLLAFAVVGFAIIWWFFAISLGERQLANGQKQLAKQGYDLRYERLEQSGFPLRLQWDMHGVAITQAKAAGAGEPLQGVADLLRVQARPWAPQRLDFVVEGQHRWRADTGGDAGIVVTQVGAASGAIRPRDTEAGWQLVIALADITARSESLEAAPLTIARLDATGQVPLAMNALELQVDLADVTLPQDTGLGTAMQSASLKAGVRPIPASFNASGARAWQAGGGLLTVHDLQVRFGALQGKAEGALGLDDALRGTGKFTLRMREPARLIASAVKAGWIQAKQQPLITMGLGLFAGRGASGQAEVALPFDLRNGGVWLGPLRLADLPPIAQ